jgi:hypothetical protein
MTLEKLLDRTRQDGECLLWVGAIDRAGYGRTKWKGHSGITAHRAVWLASGRLIPPGLELDHTCHKRSCVNLEHLRCVTHAENMANRRQKPTICKHGHTKRLMPRGVYQCMVCLAYAVRRNRAKKTSWAF